MGDASARRHLVAEHVQLIGLHPLGREQLRPVQALADQAGIRLLRQRRAMDRDLVRVVAAKVGGVHFYALDTSGMSKLQDDPVEAGFPAPARLPAVGHAGAAPGQQQIVHRAVMLVAAGQGATAIERRGQIDRLGAGRAPIALYDTVGA